jgi:hypothetical protein
MLEVQPQVARHPVLSLSMDEPIWRKSSKSYSDGHCVEVAWTGQRVLIRDSKDATGPKLEFSIKEWTSFVRDSKETQ